MSWRKPTDVRRLSGRLTASTKTADCASTPTARCPAARCAHGGDIMRWILRVAKRLPPDRSGVRLNLHQYQRRARATPTGTSHRGSLDSSDTAVRCAFPRGAPPLRERGSVPRPGCVAPRTRPNSARVPSSTQRPRASTSRVCSASSLVNPEEALNRCRRVTVALDLGGVADSCLELRHSDIQPLIGDTVGAIVSNDWRVVVFALTLAV